MSKLKSKAKYALKHISVVKKYTWGRQLYKSYNRSGGISVKKFLQKNWGKLRAYGPDHSVAKRTADLLGGVEICPIENGTFFYSIDCFKTIMPQKNIYQNNSSDYTWIVKGSFSEILSRIDREKNPEFYAEEKMVVDAMEKYCKRCRRNAEISGKFDNQFDAIESIFSRPAETFFEGLQRILFFNQFIWQTRHKNIGLGNLDMILIDLYRGDIDAGRITRENAVKMMQDFFRALHEYYWFKSSVLLGDTGQIIILGGLRPDGSYGCNELTYLFIEVAESLKIPDPKVLLRCSEKMPEDLLELALGCVATGIGQPLFSNDNAVIPQLINFGYEANDAYNYATAACWEPLVIGRSCDESNAGTINFAEPLVRLLDEENVENFSSVEDLLEKYREYLHKCLSPMLDRLSAREFDGEPLLSLLSDSAIEKGKDLVLGGAKYANIGLTSVGMGAVVNSLINIRKLVFEKGEYSLKELNEIRKSNFEGRDDLLHRLKDVQPCFGCDDADVVAYTRTISDMASEELALYKTRLGGKFKFGLSAPSYISAGSKTGATLDGRRDGEPFGTHISSATALPPTELLSFASQLDYSQNKINGNVVDFFASPSVMRKNMEKYMAMVKASIRMGVYQLQMNVVDSVTLIAARKNPDKFPDLVVRVWGFSAYFRDLPDEYKDVLIKRAIESERAA